MDYKVCFVCGREYPKKTLAGSHEIIQNLAILGLDVSVICRNESSSPANSEINSVKVHKLSTWKGLFGEIAFIVKTLAILRRRKYDIIQVQQIKGMPFFRIFGNRCSKYVLDIRTNSVSGGIRSYLGNIRLKMESRFSHKVIVLDKPLKDKLFGKKKNKKISAVPLGVNFELFKRRRHSYLKRKYGIPLSNLLILYHGAVISKSRRVDLLIKGFSKAVKKAKDINLLIVGQLTNIKSLKELCRSLGVAEKVIFQDCVSYEEIPRYINGADIGFSFIPIVNQYDVQPPLKTLEYLACGLPVIATKTKGNKRFIINYYNGLLINDKVDDIKDSILEFVKNSSLIKQFSMNARKSILQYDWLQIAKRNLIPMYEDLMSIKGAKN